MNKDKISRRILRKKRRTMVNDIKNRYKENKDLIEKEPKSVQAWGICFLGCGILELVANFISSRVGNYLPVGIASIILVAVGVINMVLEKKYKSFHKRKNSDMRDLCSMVLEEEADKYGVSKEILSLYLTQKYEYSFFVKLLLVSIPIIGTAITVYLLPGYNAQDGVVYFIILVMSNVLISWEITKLCEGLKPKELYDFYLINPYKDEFVKIERKIKTNNE